MAKWLRIHQLYDTQNTRTNNVESHSTIAGEDLRSPRGPVSDFSLGQLAQTTTPSSTLGTNTDHRTPASASDLNETIHTTPRDLIAQILDVEEMPAQRAPTSATPFLNRSSVDPLSKMPDMTTNGTEVAFPDLAAQLGDASQFGYPASNSYDDYWWQLDTNVSGSNDFTFPFDDFFGINMVFQ